MPKKIPITEKREWLQLYEADWSIASIAKKKQRNPRTIKRGVEEAYRERDTQLARSELYRDALRNHQDQLMAVIKGILDAVQLPPVDPQPDPPILLPAAKIIFEDTKGLVLVLDVEDKPEWELIKEHLGKRDPLWAMLERWKKAMINHIQARRELAHKTKWVIESKIDCKLVDNPIPPPFVYSSTTIPLLYIEALHIALGTPPRTPVGERIITDTERGEVMYESGHIFAKAPGEEEKCKRNILSAFEELKESTEAKRATQTYKEAEATIPKLRRAAEEITLLGLVTGRCRVCQRLGM